MDAACAPMHLPRTLKGWIGAAVQTHRLAGQHKLALLAAGVAFFGFLAVFPALGAGLMIWGLFADPAQVVEDAEMLRALTPPQAYEVIVGQLESIAATEQQAPAGSTLGALLALAFAIWAASKGARALILALNVAYEVKAERNVVKHYAIALAFTLGGIVFVLLSVVAIAAIPPILEALTLGLLAETLINLGRWLGAIALFVTALALLYYWAPAGARPRFRWLTPGGAAATLVWLAASFGFSIYAQNFANYNETFGSLGAAAALLMWLWISAFVICLGAQFNAVLTGQTGKRITLDEADAEGAGPAA